MKFLLLRGLMREQRHWGEFPRILQAQVPGSEVVCLDLPGTGTESQRVCPLSVMEIAQDVRERWFKIRQDGEDWNIIGVSLGGMIAIKWCSLNPHDFKRLIFVNSSAANLSPPWLRMRLAVVPNLLASALMSRSWKGREKRELAILKMTTRLRSDMDEVAKIWADFAAEQPIPSSTGMRQLWAALRFVAPTRSEVAPVEILTVCSKKDHFTDPRCSDRLAQHFQAQQIVHPHAGHDLPLDDPEWLARQVFEWTSKRLF